MEGVNGNNTHVTVRSPDYIAHIIGTVSNEDNSTYRPYIQAWVDGIPCNALVDGGNLWQDVISLQTFQRLSKCLDDLDTSKASQVSTAKQGSMLTVLGKLKRPIQLLSATKQHLLTIHPYVIKELGHDINICGPTLKKNGFIHDHKQSVLKVNDRTIPLHSVKTTHSSTQPLPFQVCPLYITHDVELKPYEVNSVQVLCPSQQNTRSFDPFLMVYGETNFENAEECVPTITALQEGKGQMTVMNPTTTTVKMKRGQPCGAAVQISKPPQADPAAHPPKTVKEVIDIFKLDESCLVRQGREWVAQLLLTYEEVFSYDGAFGATTLLQHDIVLKSGAKQPICQPYRPPNPNLQKQLEEQIKDWERQGIIEKSQSPWNFCLVAVPKKNGKIRWCIDYRALNDITQKDSHPIGHIEDNLARLSGSNIFSAVDGAGAFHVVELSDRAKPMTAFATPMGSYQFRKMPFGLCNAPSTYARLVKMVLSNVPTTEAIAYLDDTIIHSSDIKTHITRLQKVLDAFKSAGLKLQPEKCQLFRKTIDYLGHTITGDGTRPMAEYLRVVREWPMPNSRSKIRAFLGKIGYYRKFIKDFAAIAKPLSDCLKDDGKKDNEEFQTTTDQQNAFETLKTKLTKAPILAYPRFDSDHPFILDTDWSQDHNAIGGVLSQVQDGKERVIAYAAKKLQPSQAKYSAAKGELAAAIIMMRHWRYYLQHKTFTLRIDNRALLWIRTMETPSGMIQRWLETLANFDFVVQHRPGTQHGNADSLSRIDHAETPDEKVKIDDTDTHILAIGGLGPQELAQLKTQLLMEYKKDDKLCWLRRCLQNPIKEDLIKVDPIYRSMLPNMRLDRKGFIRYGVAKKGDQEGKLEYVILLPQSLWESTTKIVHEMIAHKGVNATVEEGQRFYYFPNMTSMATKVIRECYDCQQRQGPPKSTANHYLHDVTYPFQKLSLDFVGPLPLSRGGKNTYLLTVQDFFTRWLEAFPVRKATAEVVVDTLVKSVFCRYGIPERIHSDRGAQFTSKLLQDVAQTLGIQATTTPAYHPHSNPVERKHRDLKAALTALTENDPHAWETVLPQVLFAIRTTPCKTTGVAPFRMMFGRNPATPLHLIFGHPDPQFYESASDYAIALAARSEQAHAWARQHIAETVIRQRRLHHKDRHHFQKGQLVWLFTPVDPVGVPRKFNRYWTGPWTITACISDAVYKIAPDPTWQRKGQEIVSIDRLKPFYQQENYQNPPPVHANLSMKGDESAEAVTDKYAMEFPEMGPLPDPPAPAPLVNEDDDDGDEDDGHDPDDNPPPPYGAAALPAPQIYSPQRPPPLTPPRPRQQTPERFHTPRENKTPPPPLALPAPRAPSRPPQKKRWTLADERAQAMKDEIDHRERLLRQAEERNQRYQRRGGDDDQT